jgi:AmiR/NasT family two-component response regulator
MSKETILVVEDETLVGLELKEDLERMGYFVPEVIESGESVVRAVARYQPDLVLMDVRLRGSLDGIDAAYQAKAEFDLPVIYLTAYSDADTLRRAAMSSPDGFLLKPFDERELAANISIALSRAKSGEALRRELRGAMSLIDALDEPALIVDMEGRVAHVNDAAVKILNIANSSALAMVQLSNILDLPEGKLGLGPVGLKRIGGGGASSLVASVQRLLRFDGREYGSLVVFGAMEKRESRLLEASAAEANSALISFLPRPEAAGPGYRVAGFLDPCLSGSGDFFDVFSVGEGKTGFYGLDIMGHGIIASLMAFTLHDLLPALGWGSAGVELSPTGVLRALNERYSGKSAIRSTFFTIAYGVIDNATGEYRAVRGGHTPVLHLEAGGRMRIHYTKGAAVGVMADAEAEEARGTLSPGDRLIIASDGMIEAFGGEGLLDKALERLSAFADGIREAKIEEFVDAFRRRSREESAKRLSRDDVSLLVIERI